MLGAPPNVPSAIGRWPIRSMKCAAAVCISGKSRASLAAVVEQHHDRVVGRPDREHLARGARFLNHEVVGADVDERPVAGIGDGGQRDAAGAGLLLTRWHLSQKNHGDERQKQGQHVARIIDVGVRGEVRAKKLDFWIR